MRKKTKEEVVRNLKDKSEKRESATNWIKYTPTMQKGKSNKWRLKGRKITHCEEHCHQADFNQEVLNKQTLRLRFLLTSSLNTLIKCSICSGYS